MALIAKLYKPYTLQQQAEFIIVYNNQQGYDIVFANDGIEAWEVIDSVKKHKSDENDNKRDIALNQGVSYKGVLFDSDTDQKINLLAIVSTMSDEDTIVWFGMDNQPLECTKQDLINIGDLIAALHSFCWNKNALIKAEINNAQSIVEVENIEINYDY